MPTVQNLKKKLKGIRSTQKLTKAMKTASTVKYSRLNAVYSNYVRYGEESDALYANYAIEINKVFYPEDKNAPIALIVMASNKGLCGAFNSEVFSFADKLMKNAKEPYVVFVCGKKTQSYFAEKNIAFEKSFVFSDVPDFNDAKLLLDEIDAYLKDGKISNVKIIYPKYKNMMKQIPTVFDLFSFDTESDDKNEQSLFIPDKQTVIKNISKDVMSSIIYKIILETALGAQAATLMTMRSAYDTATDYCLELESEINRKRQSQVTADVIETSGEFAEKGDE